MIKKEVNDAKDISDWKRPMCRSR